METPEKIKIRAIRSFYVASGEILEKGKTKTVPYALGREFVGVNKAEFVHPDDGFVTDESDDEPAEEVEPTGTPEAKSLSQQRRDAQAEADAEAEQKESKADALARTTKGRKTRGKK